MSSYLTISPFPSRDGGLFLWHFPSSRPDRTLSCTLPYEARTFLTGCMTGMHGGAVTQRTPLPEYIMCGAFDSPRSFTWDAGDQRAAPNTEPASAWMRSLEEIP